MGGCSTYQIRKIYAIGQALGIVNRGGEDALQGGEEVVVGAGVDALGHDVAEFAGGTDV